MTANFFFFPFKGMNSKIWFILPHCPCYEGLEKEIARTGGKSLRKWSEMGYGEKFSCGTMTKCNQEVAYMAFFQVGPWSTLSAG